MAGSVLLPGARLWLLGMVYLACALVLAVDTTHDLPCAFGILYLPLVGTAACYRDPRCVWWLAALAAVMVILGLMLPVIDVSTVSVMNRGLSLMAILTTAALIRRERLLQERLSQQTTQAQAAERLKTQLLASLNAELRAPAQAILGFISDLVGGLRSDQRTVLDRMRIAAQRLSGTIENLLDLVDAAHRVLRVEALDVGPVLRQAVDAVRIVAAQRHIWLESNTNQPTPRALADVWALRRIVDNLIANALAFTPPNGHVRVSLEAAAGQVVVVVDDTGPGMPAIVLQHFGEPFLGAVDGADQPANGLGNGLALCRKLAGGIGASLAFSGEPGEGTTVRLRLRSA